MRVFSEWHQHKIRFALGSCLLLLLTIQSYFLRSVWWHNARCHWWSLCCWHLTSSDSPTSKTYLCIMVNCPCGLWFDGRRLMLLLYSIFLSPFLSPSIICLLSWFLSYSFDFACVFQFSPILVWMACAHFISILFWTSRFYSSSIWSNMFQRTIECSGKTQLLDAHSSAALHFYRIPIFTIL